LVSGELLRDGIDLWTIHGFEEGDEPVAAGVRVRVVLDVIGGLVFRSKVVVSGVEDVAPQLRTMSSFFFSWADIGAVCGLVVMDSAGASAQAKTKVRGKAVGTVEKRAQTLKIRLSPDPFFIKLRAPQALRRQGRKTFPNH
jgi:hypothetical protein